MESIAVTKPDMGVLPRHRLALSPFGALAQTFAEELLARAERAEGRWPYVPLELLEEAPPDAEPAPAPVYQVDLRLVLEALRREKGESEQRRAVERIVERVLTIRESRPAPQRKEKAGEGRERPSHTWNLNQNFYQLIRQDNRFLNGVRHPAVESGDVETPWQAPPGDLGQQARALSRRLQRLREGETVLPPLSRGREEDGAVFQPRRLERMSPPEEVRLLEQTAEQEHPAGQADGALQEAARKAVERAADILRTAAVKPAPPAEDSAPNRSSGHREGHVSARRTEQQMPLTTARDIRTSGPAAATEEQDTAARDIRTSNAAAASAEQDTAAAQKMVPAPGLASDAMRAGEQPGAPRTMPGPAGEELAYRVEEERGGGDTGEGQTARPNTPSRQTSGREAEQSIARRGRDREEKSEPVVSDAPARQAERRTALTAARDIRTSGTAAASAEQDTAAAQKMVPAPGLASDAMRAGEQPGSPRTMPVPVGEELAYRMEAERVGEAAGEGRAARPGTPSRQMSGREVEQSTARRGQGREEASVPAVPEAPTRQAERRTALTAARDIRTSSPAMASAEQDTAAAQEMISAPGLASDAVRAGEQPGAPRTMPGLTGEELAYRVEEERGGEGPVEGRAARPGTPSRQEPAWNDERGATRSSRGREEASVSAEPEAPARQAERRTAFTAARDIRTSSPAMASAEQDSAAAQKRVSAPGLASDAMRAGEQPGAPRTMPVPAGEELAYRVEEERGGEGPVEGRAARPGTPSRQMSGRETEQSPARRGQGREEASEPAAPGAPARQAERRTALTAARDIRTSGPAAVSAEQDSAAAQKRVSAPGLASDVVRAGEQPGAPRTMPGLIGEELAYRMEEERGGEAAEGRRASRPGTPSRQMSGREAEQSTAHAGQARSIPGTAARLSGIGASASGAPRLAEVGAAAQHPHWGETASGRDIRILPALRTAESTPPAAGHSALAAEAALPGEGAELAHRAGLEMGAQPGGESRAPSGRQTVRAPGGVFRVPSGASAGRGAEPVELTYGPAAPAAEPAGAPKQPPAVHAAEESEYVQSLPDWARRFLRESGGQGGQSHMGTARDISALPRPAQGEETVRWTAPGYRPPAPITYREKNREAETRQAAAPRLSEGELQRAADKIYRIIEDRIRQERRRLGL